MLYLGRAPRTKETLPDFLKWRRVTRHPLVFCELTGSQQTPGFEASQMLHQMLQHYHKCYNQLYYVMQHVASIYDSSAKVM